MALPKKLKHFNLFGNGDNWQGQIASLTLPPLVRQMEEFRGGGMNAPVDIDHGMEKLEFQWTPAGLIPELFDNFGTSQLDKDMLRFAGSYQRDDTAETVPVEIVVRGRHREINMGDAESGSDNTQSITTTVSYYKLTIGGEEVVEIDVIGMVEKIRGVDRLKEHRNNIGL
ncbi:phage major tail tube protein [Marinobacter sp. 1-3A]|jgi:P2 family phage contractile tail tube protein|uniref:phage major tail tube protein n=1 Tax=Marinobacter sp. 1-3A TaxID=2582920 RepID=UPI0019069EAA|nr:phage major tail tube protein [Marinobacter sp. 1-3A]MBK1874595.1 phage major tail tube protein [Marinobacter sp. 1-3A]